jgi:hypothetical protein
MLMITDSDIADAADYAIIDVCRFSDESLMAFH